MTYKGGASYIPPFVLHRPFYPHQLATRSNQYRIHDRILRTDLPGRRFLLFIIRPGGDGVSAQKAYDPCDEHGIRSFPAWSRRRPSHRLVPGLQCRRHIFFILASNLKSKRSDHELVCPRFWWRAAL